MLISMIILGVLGLMVIVGLGRPVLKDFRVNWIAALVFFALVIGLNFIPLITIGSFTFSVGTALFYLTAFVMFFVYGKFSTQMTAMALGLILGGLIYAATRLSLLGGNAFFATTNYVYALVPITYGMFDEKGNLKNPPAQQQPTGGNADEEDLYFNFD